ncbi:hypothetical protein [Alloalcanivorax mobilis]|uniref:hypothetical protein n=1 Tax=Alloalcanivorax mobilis TaxID=2019569 RepID=UPI0012FFE7B4|nr:hypothetical protein [Alloalcanivorax mobilis]
MKVSVESYKLKVKRKTGAGTMISKARVLPAFQLLTLNFQLRPSLTEHTIPSAQAHTP